MRQTFKILLATLLLVGAFGIISEPAYAADCTYTLNTANGEAPGPDQIVCPVIKVINVLLLASGAMLIIMLLFGGVKLALSLGDPKGMQAASGTWTWAIVGFLVVVGSITLLTVIGKLIGWQFTDPFTAVQNEIKRLMCLIGISGTGIPTDPPDCTI